MTPRTDQRARRPHRRISPWERLGQGLEQMLSSSSPPPVPGSQSWSPDIRVLDKKREVVIQILSREIDPRRIRIQLSRNILTLSGAAHEHHPGHHGYHAFRREIVLPENVAWNHIAARARGSMLIVRLEKRRPTSDKTVEKRRGDPMQVREIMTREVRCVAPETPVAEAAALLRTFDIGSVPVCRDGKIVGILTDRDIAIRVVARALNPAEVKVQEVMTPDPVTCSAEDVLVDVEQVMADAQVRRLPVVDREGRVVGYLTLGKIARWEHDLRAGHLLRGVSEPGKPVVRHPTT